MQQLRAPSRVCSVNRVAVLPPTPKCVAARPQQMRSRQLVAVSAVSEDDHAKPKTPEALASGEEEDINKRILSGEFTDSGSTKEKLTRPIRKALAQDPVGIGE